VIPRPWQSPWPCAFRHRHRGALGSGLAVFVGQLLPGAAASSTFRPCITLATSGGCFPCFGPGGALSLRSAFGQLEDKPADTLGFEQIGVNIPRLARLDPGHGQGSGSTKTPPAGLSRANHLASVRSITEAAAHEPFLWFLLGV